MSLSIYLAAPYACRDSLRPLAAELRQIGMTVTSSWLDESHEVSTDTCGAAPGIDDKQAKAHVRANFADVARSQVLIVFTPPTWAEDGPLDLVGGRGNSGGRHVETGYALALDRPVLVVGEAENIFHRALSVVPTWHDAVLWLIAHERSLPRAEPA